MCEYDSRKRGEVKGTPVLHFSITTRRRNRMQPVVAKHMRHESRRTEDFRERYIADAEPPGISTERRHHGALAVARNASSLHRAAANVYACRGMQYAGDC